MTRTQHEPGDVAREPSRKARGSSRGTPAGANERDGGRPITPATLDGRDEEELRWYWLGLHAELGVRSSWDSIVRRAFFPDPSTGEGDPARALGALERARNVERKLRKVPRDELRILRRFVTTLERDDELVRICGPAWRALPRVERDRARVAPMGERARWRIRAEALFTRAVRAWVNAKGRGRAAA